MVYGLNSQPSTASDVNFGYSSTTQATAAYTKEHSLVVEGLNPESQYYFRPISADSMSLAKGIELTLSPQPVSPPPEPPAQCNYLLEYLKIGQNNNPVEVRKLQVFLRDYEGFGNLAVSGFFDQATFDAVSVFQKKYGSDVLTPWGHEDSTGYVYITTKKKVNEIYCQKAFPLTDSQTQEINAFRNMLENLKAQGGGQIPESELEKIREEVGQVGQKETPISQQETNKSIATSTFFAGMNLPPEPESQKCEPEEKGIIGRTVNAAGTFFASGGRIMLFIFLFLFVASGAFFFGIYWQSRKDKKGKKEVLVDPFSYECLR